MKSYAFFFVLALATVVAVHSKKHNTTNPTTPDGTSAATTAAPDTPLAPTESPANDSSTTAIVTSQQPDNKTTTEAPTTTATTAEPPSTAAPEPTVGNWVVKTDNNSVCIMADMAIRFSANYVGDNKKPLTFSWNFNNKSDASGECSDKNQTMTLSGGTGDLTMVFAKQEDNNVLLKRITLTVKLPGLKDKQTFKAHNLSLFRAKVGNSYLCKSNQSVTLTTSENNTANMSTIDVQVQAFMGAPEKDAKFGEAQECPADAETSNIVPIAVGAALAALVVIVLIAYLISRNRNKRGYESV